MRTRIGRIEWKGLLFVLPALCGYIVFVIFPLLTTFRYSFFEWDGANPVMKFIGFDNYLALLKDEIFWKALVHNIIWIVSTITLPVGIGLFLAILISGREVRVKILFRISYFMPTILSLIVVAYIWDWMYNPGTGVINTLLGKFGLEFLQSSWLGNDKLVLPSLIVVGSWSYFGFCMVVFMAAIQGISHEYYEVARIEGATRFQTMMNVTIPLLRNTITFMVLNSLVGSFKVFDIIFVLTKGGPYNSSEVIATYMYNTTFTLYKVGYGAAISMTLTMVIGLVSFAYLRYMEGSDNK